MKIQFNSNFRNFDIKIVIYFFDFDEIFSEFHSCVRKCQNSLRIADKCKEVWKFREISESGDNILKNSIQSLGSIWTSP